MIMSGRNDLGSSSLEEHSRSRVAATTIALHATHCMLQEPPNTNRKRGEEDTVERTTRQYI